MTARRVTFIAAALGLTLTLGVVAWQQPGPLEEAPVAPRVVHAVPRTLSAPVTLSVHPLSQATADAARAGDELVFIVEASPMRDLAWVEMRLHPPEGTQAVDDSYMLRVENVLKGEALSFQARLRLTQDGQRDVVASALVGLGGHRIGRLATCSLGAGLQLISPAVSAVNRDDRIRDLHDGRTVREKRARVR